MSVPVTLRISRLAQLAALKAVGAELAAASLILFTNPISPSKDTLMADLVEATYSGYAAEAGLAFGTPYVGADGITRMGAPSITFVRGVGVVSEVIQGWALVNVGKTIAYYVAVLDNPVSMNNPGDGFDIDPVIQWGT